MGKDMATVLKEIPVKRLSTGSGFEAQGASPILFNRENGQIYFSCPNGLPFSSCSEGQSPGTEDIFSAC